MASSAGPAKGSSASAKSAFETVYPPELRAAERAAVRLRRARARNINAPAEAAVTNDKLPEDTIGLALSGGGIRSATFCLGVLQRLARVGLLGRIDFLSTVSGGGYIGAFWGAWINRLRDPKNRDALGGDLSGAERQLADLQSPPIRWLRENGRYLTPGGAADSRLAVAVVQRNLFMLHALLAILFGAGLWALAVARHFSVDPKDAISRDNAAAACWQWSDEFAPWLWLPAGLALAGAAFFGLVYWLPVVLKVETRRNRFARYLSHSLVLVGFFVLIPAVDLAGGILGGLYTFREWSAPQIFGPAVAAVGAAVAFASRVRGALESVGVKPSGGGVSAILIARLAAPAVALLWLVTLATVVDITFVAVAARVTCPCFHLVWIGVLVGALALSVGVGRLGCLLNDTSLAPLYGARLTRAYLGATNPNRRSGTASSATELDPGDGVPFNDYFPHRAGGPLHLINCTVNQTVDERSSLVQQDRKGMVLAIGPAGLSVAARHHALWRLVPRKTLTEKSGSDDFRTRDGGYDVIRRPDAFHALGDARANGAACAELPQLGRWIAISGAAVSTGLGRSTRPGVSLLLGFLNVRLGWWWDSGQEQRRKGNLGAVLARAFPFYAHLLGEFLARFHGVGMQRWYLSDGGHFENTAAYELVRRRVRFIIILDNGCDGTRVLSDFANLVRKARIDFNAEIEPLSQSELVEVLPPALLDFVGDTAALTKPDGCEQPDARPAIFARVRYLDGETPDSWLLLVKPTVVPSAPPDVREYRAINSSFPHESTGDQFFDEAQWESYRRLGWHIAGQLFEHPPALREKLPDGWLLR